MMLPCPSTMMISRTRLQLPWQILMADQPCVSDTDRCSSMAVFQSPGCADRGVSKAALSDWNSRIEGVFNSNGVSPFLVMDPDDIVDGQISTGFKWSANPREPRDCLGEELAASLSDQGWASRAELHNEFLEYALILRPDSEGKMRPKRFVATTELMEWWRTMAVFDLNHFLLVVETVSRCSYSCEELFGVSRADWCALDVPQRIARFHKRLVGTDFAHPPEHPLNIEHALFMIRETNSLSDLIAIMHLSSFPYVVGHSDNRRPARLDEVLHFADRLDLYCRHAGSGLAGEALDLAFSRGTTKPTGRAMAFANPLGLCIRAFHMSELFVDAANVPADWVRYPRGEAGMPMRLEFGPGDDDPRFLDDITLGTGSTARPVSGYALASLIEVGPLITVAAKPRAITRVEFVEVPPVDPSDIVCGLPETQRCKQISEFADRTETEVLGNVAPTCQFSH